MSPFLPIEISQAQIVKPCWSIDDFFNLTCMYNVNKLAKSINLSSYCHTKAAYKIVGYIQQFVLKVNQSSMVIIASRKRNLY